MKEDYANTPVYKLGKAYEEFGLMLMNKNTSLAALSKFAHEHNMRINFGIADKDADK